MTSKPRGIIEVICGVLLPPIINMLAPAPKSREDADEGEIVTQTIEVELDGELITLAGNGGEGRLPTPFDVPDDWIEITSLSSKTRRYKTRPKGKT